MSDVIDFIRENPDYANTLRSIVQYEKDNIEPDHAYIDDTDHDTCWSYDDVGEHPTTLNQLVINGVITKVFDTNSTTAYTLCDRQAVEQALSKIDTESGVRRVNHTFPSEEELPDDMFDDVVGYEKAKFLFKRAITSDDIANVLMVGPPASGKTVFLRCVRKHLEKTVRLNGNDTKSAGFIDMLFTEEPKYILYDELDDTDTAEQKSMSGYMEDGVVSETKYNKDREMHITTKTFATANETNSLLNNIQDRFLVLEFEKYDRDEFIEVCMNVLTEDENKTDEEARLIAEAVWDQEGEADVRKAIQVARLSRGDPESVIEAVEEYSQQRSLF